MVGDIREDTEHQQPFHERDHRVAKKKTVQLMFSGIPIAKGSDPIHYTNISSRKQTPGVEIPCQVFRDAWTASQSSLVVARCCPTSNRQSFLIVVNKTVHIADDD